MKSLLKWHTPIPAPQIDREGIIYDEYGWICEERPTSRLPSPRCCVKALRVSIELFEPGSEPGTCRVYRSSGPLLPDRPITVHLSAEPIKILCRDYYYAWT